MNTLRDCDTCEYEDKPKEFIECCNCWENNGYKGWAAKGCWISLESINAKLDVIMKHFGIKG